MKVRHIILLLPAIALSASTSPYPFKGKIEPLDPAFDRLVAPGTQIEILSEGFLWAEGPVWINGGVIFSDVLGNTAYRWTPETNRADVFLRPSGLLTPALGFKAPGSNGLSHDSRGRLLLCQQGERRLARYENGTFTVLADRFEGKRFNSPNDLVVRRNGEIYFTDPPYAFDDRDQSPLREIPFQGVYRLDIDGKVSLLTKEINWPNGIAFSPDEKTLYIGASEPGYPHILAFDVRPDGTIANQRLFFDARPLANAGRLGNCDGMKVDREGNLWACGPGGILVITSRGKLLGIINTGELTANCAWGDEGSSLYLTAYKFLLRIKTLTHGAGP